ncbi:LysR family transcriptional regulator [Bradyrhizobium rifense]|nr:LysR family transcriptional regulator [Bradyrhizobium rifense]
MQISGLSLDQMRAAIAVADTGSFSAAARILRRKQSAVSYAVANLERQLGVALFERSDGHAPTTTEAGRMLLGEMAAVVRRSDEIKNQAKAVARGLENELTIVIDSLFPVCKFAALFCEFAAQFPTVALRLIQESMGAVQKSVLEGKSMLGIAGSVPDLPAGLLGDVIGQVVRVPVAAREHPLTAGIESGRPLPSRALLDHVQIVISDRSEEVTPDFAVYTARKWRVTDPSTKYELLLAGIGWGYMPEHMIAADLQSGALRTILVDGLLERNRVAMMVIHRRGHQLGPAARWFLARLMQMS